MAADGFSDSYIEARERFLTAAAAADARITTYPLTGVRGEIGESLATDVACLGSEAAERVAIVVSGTHGAEGFCGSAIQTRWLSCTHGDLDNTKLVIVHAINPWAFSHRTRSDENNININRNFIASDTDYEQENSAYDALAEQCRISRGSRMVGSQNKK
jgi:predicted deacylase